MFITKLPVDGFNACLYHLPDNSGFHGTIRRQYVIGHKKYPEVLNDLLTFTLDSNFQLVAEPQIVQDIPGRIKHTSWTEGLEDARIVEPGLLLAVACDTNPHWKPEMVAVKYDVKEGKLLTIQPLTLKDKERQTEKNWLPLRHWGNELHVLHWLNPLRVLRVNLQTGISEILVEYPIVETLRGEEIHCGASLLLPQGFLVTARVKSGHGYSHSLWLLLDSDSYRVKGISEPFRFDTTSTGTYEMCMSLCLRKEDEVLACVSINDAWSGIWKFSLDTILKGLRPVVL